MNHSYRDFSQVPPQADYEHPTEIKNMTFSQKVHHILSEPAYAKWISWMPHGRAFKVHVPAMFETMVCPKYFAHRRYSSFLRELNNYGFKHVSKGVDRNCKLSPITFLFLKSNKLHGCFSPLPSFLLPNSLLPRIYVEGSQAPLPVHAPSKRCSSTGSGPNKRT